MFRTIHECRLDLVSYSVADIPDRELTLLQNDKPEKYKKSSDLNIDFMPCSAARVSLGNEDKTGADQSKDVKLMHYLAEHKHMTPFEYQHATFLVEVPLFIRSQIHRHRTFSYNEISRRYTDEDIKFWVPDTVRGQSKSNRQASDGEIEKQDDIKEEYGRIACICHNYYEALLEYGVAREQARAVLPQSLLTKFYAGANLRNWCHFLDLRKDTHAQYEIQVVADRIEQKLRELWPTSMQALRGDYEPLS